MQKTLAGLPELEQFESEEAREAALAEIYRDVDRFSGREIWIHLGLSALLMLAAWIAVDWVWPRVPVVRELPELARMVARTALYCVAFGYILRGLIRRSAPAKLRERLLASGVPVCRACGYSLRGLSLDTSRACPECGRTFDTDVRKILRGM